MPRVESLSSVPLKVRLIAFFFFLLIRAWGLTYRFRIVGNTKDFAGLFDRGDSVILACWHNRMFVFATYFCRYMLPRGYGMAMMSSDSKDGEIGATVGKIAGVRVARGSSSRRGAEGFRTLYRAIVKEKRTIVLLTDASKGPVYKAKAGVVTLAKLTSKPILPISCWADKYWRIPSWDRMIFPKPGAKVVITVGDPILVPRNMDETESEDYRLLAEKAMDHLGFDAVDIFPRSVSAI